MDQPTNYEPSASATRPQDQAIHSADRQIVETPLELHNRGLGLNFKRRELNGRQILLNTELLEFYRRQHALSDEQLKLSSEQLKLGSEQLELAKRTTVRMAMEVISLASARTSAIPVVDAPTDDSTTEQLLAPITATPTKPYSPCLPIAALPSLLVAALPAARPTAAQEGKRPAPINESTESPIAPKRHRGDGQMTNDGSATGSSLTTYRSLSEKVAVERLLAALDIPALVAPATGAPTFGVAPAAGILDRDISAFAPAAGSLAADYSAFAAPAAGALSADISAFGAPAAGSLAADYSAFGAPAAGSLAADYSAFAAPAAGALSAEISAFGAPAAGIPALFAPTVDVPAVDMRVSDSVAAAELLRMIYDVSGMVFDASGEQVTSERLLVVLGEAPYASLRYVQEAYRYIYGSALMPRTTSSQERIATLARVVAIEHWAPHLEGEVFEDIAGRNILCRRDLELGALRQNYREQLGLANDPNAAVLGPRLCYVLVRMCSMSVDLLTGPMLRSMFLGATGLDLHSLIVATEKGVQRMEANSVCQMVESWVGNIIKFIADDDNGLEDALSMATDCNALYVTRCNNGSSSNTSVAVDMLQNNELYSTLFLGNGEAKWEALCRFLVCFASKRISPRTKKCLYQLSTSLQVQLGS
ncbi:hypothetical protein H4S04_005686 [Coemansia sp. S16]|nr:hypothetical protein LPJ71_000737 [Coemansia sp. S17]KAJ2032412.1 hypothetical protein H4S03_006232 [Coemansia sp. S3946]KAJ2045359.1 hypothetical protein H4S04_005686 [Coemansia sp. S16]KAJ2062642.1 hypothetical protein GGI08_002643 [Coemansia sp. S2]KAJ2071174.1 hypothetical protein GGH13_003529 [Coemansia sp. S155-1]KAJ2098585.1 hypothetical protein GGI09_003237 [Coemansia sp. S100]KAJ2105636.1 hypothetical protein GGI16_002269 [Coemansia sp. S142-1]KAJ2347110.1 hypothetical protein GG